uniref:Uncharacterized protein n=1 Tax=Magallana gigas TaxID=29159 RepID=A0A8W8MFA5_MAGGI
MARINHQLVLGLAVLMVTQSYCLYATDAYVYMTNHPRSVDHYVSVHNEIGPEAKSTNYETRYNGEICYNLTNYVLEDMGTLGNQQWLEVTFGEDCVSGRVIVEHVVTAEEPFSVCNIYWYNRYMYSGDPKSPPTCTPVMYRYHVIFTLSKDPKENVKQMVDKYVEDNNIGGLYRYDPSGISFHY